MANEGRMRVARWVQRIAWASALVSFVVVAGSPGRRAEAAQYQQGLQDGWAFDNSGNTAGPDLLLAQFGFMQQAGAGWVRIHFRLGDCFSAWDTPGCRSDGKTARDLYDEVVNAALKHNLKVLGLLTHESWRGAGGHQADWNANNVENGGVDGNNIYIQDFANRAAGLLSAHFKGRVDAWELWTKPNAWIDNAGTAYSGGTFVYPSNYAQMLKQTGAAIRTANSNATFISGGLLGHDVGVRHQGLQGTYSGKPADCPSTLPSGGEYLCAVYNMGRTKAGWRSESPFDHVGQHVYLKQGTSVTSDDLTRYLEDVRKVYLTYGREPTSKQTHVTAFGWTTASVSANIQAQNLRTAYRTFQTKSLSRGGYVARAYWFRTRDLGNPASNPGYFDYYGLVDVAGRLKSAFSAYQKNANY